METTARKETLTVLRRLISYGEKVFCLSTTLVAPLGDRRLDPRRSTPAVGKAALVMFWALPAQPQRFGPNPRPALLETMAAQPPASADALGRVRAGLYADQLRQTIFLVYQQRIRLGDTVPAACCASSIPNRAIVGSTVTAKLPRCYYLRPLPVGPRCQFDR